jgi:hypothetical protein
MTNLTFRCAVAFGVLFGACGGSEEGGTPQPDAAEASCGNQRCEPGETPASCSVDCSTCGDGMCQPEESPATCSQDCQTVCGNGTCEVGETISSCAADCATASCTVGDPNSCTGETICIANACENAFGRNYRITVVDGVFTEANANGSAWDIGGGLPDGKVTVRLNGAAHTTPSVDDTLMPTFNFVTPPLLIPGGSRLEIVVVDADVKNEPLTADLLRAGARCSGTGPLSGAHVDLAFTPN